jgi:hypothetical protein
MGQNEMRREFDDLCDLPVRRVTVNPAPLADIAGVVQFAAVEIPALAAAEAAVLRVQEHHPESVWTFRRDSELVGIYAMLMLNPAGLERLLAGRFDFAEPPLDLLCGRDDVVTAIYKWAVAFRRSAAEGARTIAAHLQGPRYATANLYARALGAAAQRVDHNVGFRPVQPGSELLVYVRQRNRPIGPTRAAQTLAA